MNIEDVGGGVNPLLAALILGGRGRNRAAQVGAMHPMNLADTGLGTQNPSRATGGTPFVRWGHQIWHDLPSLIAWMQARRVQTNQQQFLRNHPGVGGRFGIQTSAQNPPRNRNPLLMALAQHHGGRYG